MNDSPPPGIDNTAHYCIVVLFVALSVRLKVDEVAIKRIFYGTRTSTLPYYVHLCCRTTRNDQLG